MGKGGTEGVVGLRMKPGILPSFNVCSASGIKQSILINFLVSSSIHVHTLGDDDDDDDDAAVR